MVARVNEYVHASTVTQRSNVELSNNGQQQNQLVSNKTAICFCNYKYFEAATAAATTTTKKKRFVLGFLFDEFRQHLRIQEILLSLQSSLCRCKASHLVCVCPADKVNLSLYKVQLPGFCSDKGLNRQLANCGTNRQSYGCTGCGTW